MSNLSNFQLNPILQDKPEPLGETREAGFSWDKNRKWMQTVNSGGVDNVSSVPQFGLSSLFGTQLITVPFYHASYCCFSIQGQTLQIHPRANKPTDDKDFWWPPLPKDPRHSFKVKMPLFSWILHSCHDREQNSFRRNFNQSPVRMKG